jgi:thioredoxin 2
MLIACPHCTTLNRVPPERTGEDPTCGQCGRALLDGHPVALDDARFDKIIARTELPVLLDVWAEWCGPCRMMAPQFEAAAAQLKGQVLFAKLDSDANPQTSVKLRIRSIPTLLLFRGGEEARRMSGAISAAQIVQFAQAA